MPTPPTSDELRSLRKATVETCLKEGYGRYRHKEGHGSAVEEAARRIGEPGASLGAWVRLEERAQASGKKNFLPDWSLYTAPDANAPVTLDVDTQVRERRLEQEVSSLKSQKRDLLDQIIELQDARKTVMGLADALEAPKYITPAPGSKKGGKRTAVLHLSDIHAGEHVDLYEMDGLNSFNQAICQARMERYFQKVASQLTEHWAGDPVEEIVLCLGGDMIDNNLREESRRGGSMPVVESIKFISEVIAGGVEFLRHEVDAPIRAYTSPGNHGRLTPKPHITEGNIDNLDVLVSWSVEKIIGNHDDVRFFYAGSGECRFNVYGWWFLLQHGHEGAGGTGGLYGPIYKQVRGMYRTHQTYGRRGRKIDFVLQGHDHTSAKLPFGFANGSVVGYNSYASRKLKADPSPASQNLLIVEEKHGVIAWHEMFLGSPDEGSLYIPPAIEEGRSGKPVMRVKAGKAA